MFFSLGAARSKAVTRQPDPNKLTRRPHGDHILCEK